MRGRRTEENFAVPLFLLTVETEKYPLFTQTLRAVRHSCVDAVHRFMYITNNRRTI